MTVIQFPKKCARSSGGGLLAVFAHSLPELVGSDGDFDGEWLAKCILNTTKALFAVRRLRLPIAHLVLTPDDQPHRETALSVPGLKARPSEAVFFYDYPSVFSGPLFSDYLQECGISGLALFGFTANDVGLVSAIEAKQRDCELIVLRDCSPLLSIDDCTVEKSDAAIFGTIAQFSSVMTLPDFIEKTAGKGGLSPAIFPPVESLIDGETLRFLNTHNVAGQFGHIAGSGLPNKAREMELGVIEH